MRNEDRNHGKGAVRALVADLMQGFDRRRELFQQRKQAVKARLPARTAKKNLRVAAARAL